LQERDIEQRDNCFGEAAATVDFCGEAAVMVDHLEELQASSMCVIFRVKHNSGDTSREECGDGFECCHHVRWFRVERGRTACTIVLGYMSIRPRESVSLGQLREIQHSGHHTTGLSSSVSLPHNKFSSLSCSSSPSSSSSELA